MKSLDWNRDLYSKSDFQDLLMKIITPVIPYYTVNKAGLDLGITATAYDKKAILFEGFARILWGLSPFWAGGGSNPQFERIYLQGIASGVNPDNTEYWGTCTDYNQRLVDMVGIAYALLLSQEKVWEPLPNTEKDMLAKWMYTINDYKVVENNWCMFPVIVNLTLKKINRKYSQEKIDYYLDQIENFYIGDGWYMDGLTNHKDYYVTFAIHFYSLIYVKEMKQVDQKRCAIYKERAERIARDFIHWFDENGAGIPYGRSMIYRFAQISFFSACLIADIKPFPVGIIKGLIVRNILYWINKPINDYRGIQTIGYGYPNLYVSEFYNSPGSPYWSLKVFALLLLPDSHLFWSTEIEPMPKREDQITLYNADMIIHHYKNHTTAYTVGKYHSLNCGHFVEKYGKFTYDSKFGICVSKSNYELWEAAPDGMLAFLINGYVYVRRVSIDCLITDGEVYSKWSPYPGIVVETTITPTCMGHIRKHLIQSDFECEAYDCGFAVRIDTEGEKTVMTNSSMLICNKESGCEVSTCSGNGVGFMMKSEPNTNYVYPMTMIPSIRYDILKGENIVITEIKAWWGDLVEQ